MNSILICPICGEPIYKEERSYKCCNNHSFDIARQGYINLLTVQKKHSLNPGDTKEQVVARREFLSEGFYEPIVDALKSAADKWDIQGPLLDIGCGEGYYCTQLAAHRNISLLGIDISKEAVRFSAGKYKDATWLCATAAHLPIRSGSIGAISSLFALTLPKEFGRVLGDHGLYLQILAAEDHLLGLKRIIYPELIFKEKNSVPALEGFSLLESVPIRFSFTVKDQQIKNLLSMTPHAHRITKEGAQRLSKTEVLTDEASCVLNIYRKTT